VGIFSERLNVVTSFAQCLKVALAVGACLSIYDVEGSDGPMTVAITRPADGASFQIGTKIQFSVVLENASSNGVRVTYYEGAKVRARATAPPFNATWTSPALGQHAITAVVTDKAGNRVTSQSIRISVGPPNDRFDNAIPLKAEAPVFSGTTVGASLEPGEPNWGGGSVWYSWTPVTSGRLEMSMPKWPFGVFFGAYTGDAVSNLTTVANNLVEIGSHNNFNFAAQAGLTYKIVVAGRSWDIKHFAVKSSFTLPPPNDDFEHRATLPPYGGTATVSSFGATWQSGEPVGLQPIGYEVSHRTVWWTWTAPVKGRVSFNADCNFASTIAVFTGNTLTNLVEVGYRITGEGPYDVVPYDVLAGATYQIVVDGYGGQAGTVKLTATFNPAPVNDDFSHSQIITGAIAVLKGTTLGATSEPGESARYSAWYSVWYSWTAPASAYATINPIEGPTGAPVTVYTGSSLTNLALVAEGEAGKVSFNAIQGTTYQISIAGFQGWQSTFELQLVLSTVKVVRPLPEQSFAFGSKIPLAASSTMLDGSGSEVYFILNSLPFGKVPRTNASAYLVNAPLGAYTIVAAIPESGGVVHWSPPVTFNVRPENDAFADRTILTGSAASIDGTIAAASSEDGEPQFPGVDDASVWYSWTAPADGVASVRTTLGNLGVFTGSAVTNLTYIPTLDWSSYQFMAVVGTTYAIRVSDYYGNSFHFSLDESIAPINDDFTNRTVLIGDRPGANGTLFGCSMESGEPTEASNGASAWYSWTAPFSGLLFVTNSVHSFDIFKGDSLSTLTSVGSSPLRVQGGDTFQIQISSFYGFRSNVQISYGLGLTLLPPPPNDDFCQAAPLNGTSFLTNGYYAGGTIEAGEPAPRAAAASLWYTWTAPAAGRVVIIGTQSALSLAAYTGNSLSNLTFIADSTQHWNGYYYFELNFNALAETNYHIALFAPDDPASFGNFQLSLNMPGMAPTPTNGNLVTQALLPPTPFLQHEWPLPTLTNPRLLSSGRFQFELHGLVGATYTVFSATNLLQSETTWESVVTTNLSGSAAIIRDDAATNSHRFYRVRQER
jgi:hypothetical protein